MIEIDSGHRLGPGRGWRVRLDDVWGALVAKNPREARAIAPFRRAAFDTLRKLPDIDLVVVEFEGLAPLALRRNSFASPLACWVITLHNLQSRMALQQRAVMPKRRQRWLYGKDAKRATALESQSLKNFDRVIAVSPLDAQVLGHLQAHVVPNGVDLVRFQPSPIPASPALYFSGSMYTTPNFDAAGWFCRDIWPLVRQSVPAATLSIVGANPPPTVMELGRLPGVEIHADVTDVRLILSASRVVVVPLRIGSGTRIKVLEAWASGRPVVGTTIGLEGLTYTADQEVLVADDPVTFAASIVRLLNDDQLARNLATAGRRVVEQNYGWDAIGRAFTEQMEHLLR
jgi:glycosyltransferase involved in cell wall biosynthesis